jgi:hypothetical protein
MVGNGKDSGSEKICDSRHGLLLTFPGQYVERQGTGTNGIVLFSVSNVCEMP